MEGDSVELSLISNLVRKVKMGISSREGFSLMTKANTFIKQGTREEVAAMMSGNSGIKPIVKLTQATYSIAPL